jgi:hypothetical protein
VFTGIHGYIYVALQKNVAMQHKYAYVKHAALSGDGI